MIRLCREHKTSFPWLEKEADDKESALQAFLKLHDSCKLNKKSVQPGSDVVELNDLQNQQPSSPEAWESMTYPIQDQMLTQLHVPCIWCVTVTGWVNL